jgi:glycine betaine/proline transport system ATP-binding protein
LNGEPFKKVEDLTLIFGKRKKEALELLNQGYSKTEILKKTKCTGLPL